MTELADVFANLQEQREAIATAAYELNELRENWRNPTDMFGNPALNADQPLQRLSHLARQRPRQAGRGGGRRLRLSG